MNRMLFGYSCVSKHACTKVQSERRKRKEQAHPEMGSTDRIPITMCKTLTPICYIAAMPMSPATAKTVLGRPHATSIICGDTARVVVALTHAQLLKEEAH